VQAFKLLLKGRDREEGLKTVIPLAEAFPEVAAFAEFVKKSERGTVR
jgi:UDP-N-acetylglucosamine acyltransferase